MFSTRQKKQQNRRYLSQLDDFDQDVFIADGLSSGRQMVLANSSPVDRELTVKELDINPTTKEISVIVEILECCLADRIDKEKRKVVETVEKRIKKAILTATDYFITLPIELALKSINAFSGPDVANFRAKSKHAELIRITTCFEHLSDTNNTFHKLNVNYETRGDFWTRYFNFRPMHAF